MFCVYNELRRIQHQRINNLTSCKLNSKTFSGVTFLFFVEDNNQIRALKNTVYESTSITRSLSKLFYIIQLMERKMSPYCGTVFYIGRYVFLACIHKVKGR